MLETLLITWRESLEAALIVGILLTYLARSGQRAGVPYVWAGTAAAVLAALGCAAASNGLVAGLDADVQELVQVGVLLLAVGVLTWMVLWMHRHARAAASSGSRRSRLRQCSARASRPCSSSGASWSRARGWGGCRSCSRGSRARGSPSGRPGSSFVAFVSSTCRRSSA